MTGFIHSLAVDRLNSHNECVRGVHFRKTMRLIRLLKKDLAHEARDWLEKGIITRDQATAICAEYDIDLDSDSHQSGYRLLTTLGYLFIGLAVIT